MHFHIQEYIYDHAFRNPDKIAIVFGREEQLTYKELHRKSNQFAHFLIEKGIKPKDIVPILSDKQINIMIAIIGILKAGGIYSPLNPELSQEALTETLREISPQLICVDNNLQERCRHLKLSHINLNDLAFLERYSESTPSIHMSTENPAYIIFTSGTTGKPKGVVISHRNLVYTYESWKKVYKLQESDNHLQLANISFDVFSGDWIRALCSGGKLVLCTKKDVLQPENLFKIISEEKITFAEFVPSTLRFLMEYCVQRSFLLTTFRVLVIGSDLLRYSDVSLARKLSSENTEIYNSYGCTEASIDSNYKLITLEDLKCKGETIVPIGQPFPHVFNFMLNENMEEVKPDETGELYLGGEGIGIGYFNNPQLTSEKFQIITISGKAQRLYKTGDLGRKDINNNIFLIGRNEMLVKIDGKRIELPDIENTLMQNTNIQFACVSAVRNSTGNRLELRAFIKFKDLNLTFQEITAFLRGKLPAYHPFPKEYFIIDSVPYTSNGKVDRKSIQDLTNKPLVPNITLPRNALEKTIHDIWKRIIGSNNIGIDNTFCSLGGSSLDYIKMLEELNKKLDVYLSPQLNLDTIMKISSHLSSSSLVSNQKQPVDRPKNKIVIVGGGPAAISMCMHIVEEFSKHKSKELTEILVFEKSSTIGPGLPYSKKEDCYILNLPKDIMEPVFGQRGKFSHWLKSLPGAPQDTDFPPRYCFGLYLKFLAEKIQKEASDSLIKISYFVDSEVLDLNGNGENFLVITSKGAYEANYVVCCTGHMPSSNYTQFVGLPGYFHNPWEDSIYSSIDASQNVVIIGSRLTAIDVALKLSSLQHKGKIIMVSHSGLLPTVLSRTIPPYPLKYLTLESFDCITQSWIKSLPLDDFLNLFWKEISEAEGRPITFNNIKKSYKDISPIQWIDEEIKIATLRPKPWQQVLFAMYPIIPHIWAMLDFEDKKRFIRDYKSLFLTYLAAFPLQNAYLIRQLLMSEKLMIKGGVKNIEAMREGGKFNIEFEDSPAIQTTTLINATGPGYNPSRVPLFRKLIHKNLMCKHYAGGINVDPKTLQIMDRHGKVNPKLFAVGEITWGACLATTDMSRVAFQSSRVATVLQKMCQNSKHSRFTHRSTGSMNLMNPSPRFFRRYLSSTSKLSKSATAAIVMGMATSLSK